MMNRNRHLISKYLEGELDALSASRFEEDLSRNPDLRKELDLYRKVDMALADAEVMELRMQLHEMHTQMAPAIHDSARHRYKRVAGISIAASLLIIMGFSAINYFWLNSSKKLVERYYQPYEMTSANRSGFSETDQTLRSALELYQSQHYSEAVVLFEKALEKEPTQMATQLYSGISYFEISEYVKAVKSFSKVIEHNDNLYIEQAKWYLGLCYLRTEEKEKAVKQFREIANSNSYFSEKAKTILKKLR